MAMMLVKRRRRMGAVLANLHSVTDGSFHYQQYYFRRRHSFIDPSVTDCWAHVVDNSRS